MLISEDVDYSSIEFLIQEGTYNIEVTEIYEIEGEEFSVRVLKEYPLTNLDRSETLIHKEIIT